MTSIEIKDLTDRELDLVVAENIMQGVGVPRYSVDIKAAWSIAFKMRDLGFSLTLDLLFTDPKRSTFFNAVFCKVEKHPKKNVEGKCGSSDSGSRAICLAALRAIGINEVDDRSHEL